MIAKMTFTTSDLAARRAAARRTALILGAVAVAMFVGFILHVVLRLT